MPRQAHLTSVLIGVWAVAMAGLMVTDPDLDVTIKWFSLLAASLATAEALLAVRAARKAAGEIPELTIDDRVRTLRSNLASSRRLIKEVNAEFELQAVEAERIKAEAEQNQRLAQLTAQQVQA